jgi:predicted metal-dependent phosphoesterase TrpH
LINTHQNIIADLHTHSIYSDGIYSPRQLINKAFQAKITIISITDHDNVFGMDEAYNYAKYLGIEFIPGVEISCEYRDKEVHLLGYFIDFTNQQLISHMNYMHEKRIQRAEDIIKILNSLGLNVNINEILEELPPESAIGRPHIANVLLKKGYVNNLFEAFYKYLGEDKPAFIKKPKFDISQGIELIKNSGGLSFIAHPAKHFNDEMLIELADSGVDGLETIHPSHSNSDTTKLRSIANQYFLLESGGSDFHGDRANDEKNFGKVFIDGIKFNNIKKQHKMVYG